MPKIEIYTQEHCPYCTKAVALLTQKNVAFEQIDAPRGSAAREEATRRSGGSRTVPQIFIDDRVIGGCSELFALEQQKKLDPLLRRAG
ncbi:glutaredoxin 3 [Candidatus Kirkpatrickella diaphorinae]|uniref:Glutaredoxin n=1 Tax=Candidatus Kirkpatrickella diaphorinae TaxID=2984322 RepID=A0ABY6GJR0_9PROT|nr:glutaredoxin 3 [Candidatus Kirkpatrickella diaphorinae]UYH51772.1 glutaredoxin 3 [Candidatus Kirkpatrickella diaphorinae]